MKHTNVNRYFLNDRLKQQNAYSTEEQVIGTWIDGKPLYRKTFVQVGIAQIDIANLNFDTIMLDLSASFFTSVNAYGTKDIISPYYSSTVNYYYMGISGDKKIFFQVGTNSAYLIGTYTVTIKYTKTTD